MGNKGSSLNAIGSLNTGEYLLSSNGVYEAIMQADGNFVVYEYGSAIWSTGTNTVQSTTTNGVILQMQLDGNLVIYHTLPGGVQTVLWACNVAFGPDHGPYTLTMGNDGNLIIVGQRVGSGATVTWSTKGIDRGDTLHTSAFLSTGDSLISLNRHNTAQLMPDGNFQVRGFRGIVLESDPIVWDNHVHRKVMHGSYILFLQTDGNLVDYQQVGAPAMWASNSMHSVTGQPDTLVMQNDGNLVLYDASGKAIWSTNTVWEG